MSEPITVLQVANFSDRVGGGEESLLLLLRHLHPGRVRQILAAPREGDMLGQADALGVPGVVLPTPPVLGWPVWSPATAAFGFLHFLRRHPVSLVHAHGARGALYAGVACRLARLPLVWHVRIAAADTRLDWLLARLATQVVAISKAVAGRFARLRLQRPVVVIPNAVDEAPLADARSGEAFRRAHGLDHRPLIALVARLSPEKGQAVLLEALPRIAVAHPNVAVLFAGTGHPDQQAALAAKAEALGVAPRCVWLGHVDPVAPVLHAADVVALPSAVLPGWAEGFGRVLVEAALCGKPVVATRTGGIPEVVRDGETGLLVPAADPRALANALCLLLEDPDLRHRMGLAGVRNARERFSVRAHCQRVMDLYAELAPPLGREIAVTSRIPRPPAH
ncbi:MAG TPA: glycosyltransferase family 4 protein [Candidatus Acidoferrum sp.]|nr:glycosyltransferase family 4 protein [Candidatus Acidoferrum sp.]